MHSNDDLTDGFVKNYLKGRSKLNWKSFDELIECQNSLWELRVSNDCDCENLQNRKVICSCPSYLKNNICVHSLALSTTLKFVSFPPEAKSMPLEKKTRRGRPSLAKRALLTQ